MTGFQPYKGLEITSANTEENAWLEALQRKGFFVVENVLPTDLLERLRLQMDQKWQEQLQKYGAEYLENNGEYGQIRGMMAENGEAFLSLIIHPLVEKVLPLTVGNTAILHLQNGIVLHPERLHNQARFHRDFPKDFIPSKILSINFFFAIDAFTKENGGTWLVPGSHLEAEMPSLDFMNQNAVQVECPAGSVIVFDSMVWHKGGENRTSASRRAINQQYTRPFIKQQLDYPVLMKGKVDRETTIAQRLGMWAIPPKSVEEFRVDDPSKRTYRAGQG